MWFWSTTEMESRPFDRTGLASNSAMARAIFDVEKPTVGLLNVGVEEIKGQEEVKDAGRMLRAANLSSMTYHGFVEGNDIGKGTVDVVVTEGFAGNIALKTAEGTARQIAEYLRSAMSRTLMAKIGYVFAKGAFNFLREKMDVRKSNGGVFLGLNGIVVKSHGGADAFSFSNAIGVAVELAEKVFGDLKDSRVMLLGAGDMSRRCAQSLQSRGASGIIVSNRSQSGSFPTVSNVTSDLKLATPFTSTPSD